MEGCGVRITIMKTKQTTKPKADLKDNESVLSVHARNILSNAGYYPDKSVVKKAILNGGLRLQELRNCGKKTTCEIILWAGIGPFHYEKMLYSQKIKPLKKEIRQLKKKVNSLNGKNKTSAEWDAIKQLKILLYGYAVLVKEILQWNPPGVNNIEEFRLDKIAKETTAILIRIKNI
jgi:hypothetical protein